MSPADLQRAFASYDEVVLLALGGTLGVIVVHFLITRLVRPTAPGRWSRLQRLGYVGFVIATSALAGTAFFAVFTDGHLLHWPLLIHVVAAGPFVVLLAWLALTFARAAAPRRDGRAMGTLAKAVFAVLLLASAVTAASMLASMFPLFGTADMERLLDVHRFAGLTAVCAVLLHVYLTLTEGGARRRARSEAA